ADTPRALVLSVVVRDWGEEPDALAAAFAQDRHAPAPPSPEERERLLAADPLAGAPDATRADLPQWVAPSLAESLGERWIAEGQGMAARPPLDLRVNTLKASRERVSRALVRFSPEETPLTPTGLRI